MTFTKHLLPLLILSLTACSAPQYRSSVAGFGTSVVSAVSAQQNDLNQLSTRQSAEIRTALANRRERLVVSPGCAPPDLSIKEFGPCAVTYADGRPLPTPENFLHISALGKALTAYGASLSALASDISADEVKFNTAMLSLAGAIDGLDASLSENGTADPTASKRRKAVATISGSLGNAMFRAARVSKLRKIIIETDPAIQAAIEILAHAAYAISDLDHLELQVRADVAQTKLGHAIAAKHSTATIKKLQADLFAAVDALNQAKRREDTFLAVGKAHAALAEASRKGVHGQDMRTALQEVITLIGTVKSASGNL